MQLSKFLELAADLAAEEWPGFARVCSIYWDARLRGARGLSQQDPEEGDVEILVEHGQYEPAFGIYILPKIDELLHEQPGVRGLTEEAFEGFWHLYPRKVGKAAARKVWLRKIKSHAQAMAAINALRAQILAYDWSPERPQFIPHPTTWLNQERWDDVVTVEAAGSPSLEGVV
jgi:hypothetical protein